MGLEANFETAFDEAEADVARALEILASLGAQLGTISSLERAVGESKGFLKHRLAARDLRATQLARVGQLLGVRLGFPLTGNASGPRIDYICPRMRERKKTRVEAAAEAALLRHSQGLSPTDLAEQLEAANQLRWENPFDALDLVERACHFAAPEQVPYLLGAATACFRMLHQYKEGARAIARGMELALAAGDRLAVGLLLQKCVYLYDSMGAPEAALDYAKAEYEIFSRLQDERRMGEALVDQAICWFQLRNFEASLLALNDASRHASAMNVESRATRLLQKSLALRGLGKREEALEQLRLAVKEAESGANVCLQGKLFWAEGEMLGIAGAGYLEKAVQLLTPRVPIDAALASVALARIYLVGGSLGEACRVARGMICFVQPLVRIGTASRAIRDLVLIGDAGRGLTLKKLVEAEHALQKSRLSYYRFTRKLK